MPLDVLLLTVIILAVLAPSRGRGRPNINPPAAYRRPSPPPRPPART